MATSTGSTRCAPDLPCNFAGLTWREKIYYTAWAGCHSRFVRKTLHWNCRSKGQCGRRMFHNTFCNHAKLHMTFVRFFFFSPLLFEPQKSQILGLFYWAVSRHWTKRVGHFYPGGSGIAGELAKSKPELLKEGLGGGWARGVGLGPRPGVGSREDHYLQHW